MESTSKGRRDGFFNHLELLREEDILPIVLRTYELNESFLQEMSNFSRDPKYRHFSVLGKERTEVITEALRAGRIETLCLRTASMCDEVCFDRQLEDIFRSVSSSNLENLILGWFDRPETTAELLSKYLKNGFRILYLKMENFNFSPFGLPRSMPPLALLAGGFAANTTLESIVINPSEVMEDGEGAILLRGLISHPKLQSLEVTKQNCGAETMEALHRIFAVASSTRTGTRHFKHLSLAGCRAFDMESFLTLLRPINTACAPNTTTQSPYCFPLKSLELVYNTLKSADANLLLRTLLKSGQCCPNLERVSLVGNYIYDWSELTKDLLRTRMDQEQHNGKDANTVCFPCPLQTLDLTHYDLRVPCTPMRMKSLEALKCISELMDAFPRLGSLGEYISFPLDFHLGSSSDATVAHQLNLRRFLGVAFPSRRAQEDREIPLSLWPLLLAKPPLWQPASVIFKVLQEYGADLVRGPHK